MLMKRLISITIAAISLMASFGASGEEISITTDNTKLTLWKGDDGLLTVRGYGLKRDTLNSYGGSDEQVQQFLFYPTYGDGFLGDSALQVTHADGDIATRLEVQDVKVVQDKKDKNIITTEILMKDPAQDFYVTIYLRAYQNEDVIQIWTKIENKEKGGVTLHKFASASVMNFSPSYWLTHFTGSWANEANMTEEKLTRGKKEIYSNLGSRAHRMATPMFLVSLLGPSNEDSAYMIGGTLMWPGSFSMRFDIDSTRGLRMTMGGDNRSDGYYLDKGESLETPKSLWVFSDKGKNGISQKFHKWGRKYSMRNPKKPRPVLLNNWEATGMGFDENRLVGLFEDAKGTGVDIFLLDDGWFGGKYVRNADNSSLGDWKVAEGKLPSGLGYLCKEAKARGMEFGIWLEPEMVSPKSELFEAHPEWALRSANRNYVLGRNQLVLDLTNPEVKKYVWKIFEDTLRPNPIKYVKWDANCCIYQPVSDFQPKNKKGNVDFEYNKSLLDIMKKFSKEFPDTAAMLCSGGGGRVDYASLQNFESFWASDNTDPMSRVFIQWGFGHFYPSNSMSAHVTHMGGRPMKFCADVAMSGALGFDLDISKVSPEDKEYIKKTIELYKKEIRPITSAGDYYRLKSPYEHAQSAVMFVNKGKGVVFVYQTRDDENDQTVKLKGLDPDKTYTIKEVGFYADGQKSEIKGDGQAFKGRELMENGIVVPTKKACGSSIILLSEKK